MISKIYFMILICSFAIVTSITAEVCEENDLACQMQGKVETAENEPALNPNKVDDKTHKRCLKKPDNIKCLKTPDCYWDSTVKGGKCKGNGHP
ncbi:hypothetical protein AB3N60_14145 [Leptospira sp. WS39.C2]